MKEGGGGGGVGLNLFQYSINFFPLLTSNAPVDE